MNKILKILSILVIGFVMFSCSTPTNDPTPYVPEPSGPETPVETPSDDPVEETPEEPTYSITFIAEKGSEWAQPIADLLNSLPDYKKLKEGTEVEFPTFIYIANIRPSEIDEWTLERTEISTDKVIIQYEGNKTSVVVGNEDIEIKYMVDDIILL